MDKRTRTTPQGQILHRTTDAHSSVHIPSLAEIRMEDHRNQMREMHRKMQIQLSLMPKKAKFALGAALILCILTYGYIFNYFFIYNHLGDRDYLEMNKCPACYGTSLCFELQGGTGKLTGYSKLQFLNFLANIKNVNNGRYGARKVVYKKLAHDSELRDFDDEMCKKAKLSSGCNVGDAMPKVISGSRNLNVEEVKGISDLTKCPSLRLVNKMMDTYVEKADAIDLSFPEKLAIITTLKINPEPLMLQMFPRSEGYPFPDYIGACGRFIVVEDVGKPLSDFYDAPWEERIDYATQIFRMAELFSDPPSSFALYWTDVSYENFAVDSNGKVRIVDAENIIVVDKWKLKLDKNSDWDKPYSSPFDECDHYGTCLGIDDHMLCTRYTVDHNYYAACRNLLSSYGSDYGRPDGLLHDTPEEIEQRYHLDDMLRECAKPSKPNGGRMEMKDQLLETMEEIRRRVM